MIDSWERLALKYLKHYIIIKYTIFFEHRSIVVIEIFDNTHTLAGKVIETSF